jgi:hypothetical protein
MSFPATYNIQYYYGDTYEFVIFPKNTSGDPFSLEDVNWEARFTIATARGELPSGEPPKIEGFAEIAEDRSSILCTIRPSDADAIDPDRQYVYDVEIRKAQSPYDFVYTLLTGNISVTKDITEAVVQEPDQEPLNPVNLEVSEETFSSFKVEWDQPTSGGRPSSYKLVILPYTEDLEQLQFAAVTNPITIPGTASSFTFSGLFENTEYSVAVLAANATGNANLDTILTNTEPIETLDNPLTIDPDFAVFNNANAEYRINNQANPTLVLTRGQTYTFGIQSPGQPFWIQSFPAPYNSEFTNVAGVNGNGTQVGVLTFSVPGNAPGTLFYTSQNNPEMFGVIEVVGAIVNPDPTAPAAPTINSITPGDESLVVNFTAGGDGGATITNYKYSIDGINYVELDPVTTTSPFTITGLTNDTSYPITIKAVNAIGDSDSSNSVSGTPVAPEPEPEPEIDFAVTSSGASAYIINGVSNDTLTLVRGQTYIFDIDATGHPFWIQTVPGAYSEGDVYNLGISNIGTESGTITWTVDESAPNTLYYVCQFHSSMQGTINIIDGES